MKITIQFGEDIWQHDDSTGSETPFYSVVEKFNGLLKGMFPSVMADQRVIVVDEEFAAELMGENDEEEHLCEKHAEQERRNTPPNNPPNNQPPSGPKVIGPKNLRDN